ncbi:hypothetical protein [Thermocatellispora tengchongensis]|uniref:hypothetical protein n=1 Tax=Thermocatellispora tengchongensis TaxID=1073253 RepID=UPI0036333481
MTSMEAASPAHRAPTPVIVPAVRATTRSAVALDRLVERHRNRSTAVVAARARANAPIVGRAASAASGSGVWASRIVAGRARFTGAIIE